MTIEATLYIDPAVDADQLARMGGRLVRWEPGTEGAPARASFTFKNRARFDKFLADALAIRGVRLDAELAEVSRLIFERERVDRKEPNVSESRDGAG